MNVKQIQKKRCIFMGTPEFAVPSLRALLESEFSILGVYTQPDRESGRGKQLRPSPIKKFAVRHGLMVCQPESFQKSDVLPFLEKIRPEVIIVAAYGLILPRWLLEWPTHGTLNVHPSLLPRHRGPSPVANAILQGDEVTGVTVMLIQPKLDTGPILNSKKLRVNPKDTTGSLTLKLADIGAKLLVETLDQWVIGRINPLPQNEIMANYSKLFKKADAELNWNLPAVDIWRQVRAFDPWPGTFTTWKGKRVRILEVEVGRGINGLVPGEVVELSKSPGPSRISVATGEGTIFLKQIQIEGKKALDINSFVAGHRDFKGSVLPSFE